MKNLNYDLAVLRDSAHSFIAAVCHYIKKLEIEDILQVASVIERTRISKNSVYIFGNGGSAATANHIASDFSTILGQDGIYLKAYSLNANLSTFSAIANDYGYSKVFSYQLRSTLGPDDVVFGISASGNSPNCIEALSLAKEYGSIVIGLLGFDGGGMKSLCDYFIHIPVKDYFLVESIHLITGHLLTSILKELNFSK
jgi:D-sedoheptulose 7-phosphate isomerase